jgi:putative transcriptional regulator
MTRFGKKLIESAHEALAIAAGDIQPARAVQVETIDVVAIRKRLKLSQHQFARRFALSASTVKDWEQGRRQPDRIARNFLRLIDHDPETVARALSAG